MKYQIIVRFDADTEMEANSIATDIEQALSTWPGPFPHLGVTVDPVSEADQAVPPHANHDWVPNDVLKRWECAVVGCPVVDPYMPGQRALRREAGK